MKKNYIKWFILWIFLFVIFGCTLTTRTLLGVDTKPDFMSNQVIAKKAKSKKISPENLYFMTVDSYYTELVKDLKEKQEQLTAIDSLEIAKLKKEYNNNLQPVQLRIFDSSGTSIFKLVNCFIDPPIPMNWNIDGSLDSFPPKPIIELKEDDDENLNFFLPFLVDANGASLELESLPVADYYVMVFWNDFFIRPSKKLIKQIRKYQKKFDFDAHFIWVNNHNAHLFNYVEKDYRDEALEYLDSLEN